MKVLWKEICTAIFMGAIIPGMLLNISAIVLGGNARELPITEIVPEAYETDRVTIPVSLRCADGSIKQMDMDEYITGVVLGEMPADFEIEALKAQSVAARTYTAKSVETGGKHGDGTVCTDYACCQAYLSEETYLAKGGTSENLEKVKKAVLDTSGYVLAYEGQLIEATYFSCSGGSTEDAASVWGTDYPYLQAVPSPGEENAEHFSDTMQFSRSEFEKRIGCTLIGEPAGWFEIQSYTPGGGIESITICGEAYTGTTLRRLLKLPSTIITLSVEGDTIIISTKGYGHRVGMSQYGADAMAVNGSRYPDILEHYYPGTKLEKLNALINSVATATKI